MNVWGNVKKLSLGGMIASSLIILSSLSMTGCLTDDGGDDNAPKITGLAVNGGTDLTSGTTAAVNGIVEDGKGVKTVTIKVLQGSTDVTDKFTISAPKVPTATNKTKYSIAKAEDGNVTISTNGAANGDYTISLTAVNEDDKTTTATAGFKVTGTVATITTADIVLGANQNAAPGSIDLDEFKAYTHANAKPISDKIDLYYAHAGTNNEDRLFTPAQAKVSGFGTTSNGPATWSIANATQFKELDLSEVEFNAVTTQIAIDALWATTTTLVDKSAKVSSGSTFVVNTDQGKKVLILVTAYTAGDAGSITLKGTK